MRFIFLSIVFQFLANYVFAGEFPSKDMPFVPAYAAQQTIITSKSIELEGQQFEKISEWLVQQDQVATKRLERDQAKEALERARKLFEKGVINEGDFRQSQHKLETAEAELNIVIAQQDLQRVEGLKFKNLLLSEGNPQLDFRLDVAKALEASHLKSKLIYSAQLEGAESGVRFWRFWVAMGQKLYEKRLIKKSELEQRELILKMVEERLAGIQSKLKTIDLALEGVRKTIQILQ